MPCMVPMRSLSRLHGMFTVSREVGLLSTGDIEERRGISRVISDYMSVRASSAFWGVGLRLSPLCHSSLVGAISQGYAAPLRVAYSPYGHPLARGAVGSGLCAGWQAAGPGPAAAAAAGASSTVQFPHVVHSILRAPGRGTGGPGGRRNCIPGMQQCAGQHLFR